MQVKDSDDPWTVLSRCMEIQLTGHSYSHSYLGWHEGRRTDMAHAEKPTMSASSNSFAASISRAGKKHAEALSAMQADLFKELQEMGEHWKARAKSETELGSELLGKLTNARSIPETATAYQEWAIRRSQMAVEDGQRLFADNVKLMETAARLLSNGGARGST